LNVFSKGLKKSAG